MRIIALLPLTLLAAACQVTEDDQNDQVTVQYNQDLAENVAADIANGAEQAVDSARNVDVDIDTNTADNTNRNSN
jgi:uncharacterized protein YfiM (DUF2279 family)